jgi:hypothetical protein
LLIVIFNAGLQVLGPENVAIVRLRSGTILIAALWTAFAVVCLKVNPGIIILFYGDGSKSNLDEIEENAFALVYFVFPMAAITVNIIGSLYSKKLNREIDKVARM